MYPATGSKLVIAISSTALFDLSESCQVFEQQGLDAYSDYQIAHEDELLAPGVAFPLVEKLLKINSRFDKGRVEVILLSRNSCDTGLRIFNSIEHYKLDICRAAFCGGASPYRYVSAFGSHLFLSNNRFDVERALAQNVAAATVLSPAPYYDNGDAQLRFAFDGDAVLFSDEAERIYHMFGYDAFTEYERREAKTPLGVGPFKAFMQALHDLQTEFPGQDCPIRTALVTARSAPNHERVVRTLRAWNVRLDEALFLGGLDKAEFLQAYNADIFFDDMRENCDSVSQYVTAGHVPHGIRNH